MSFLRRSKSKGGESDAGSSHTWSTTSNDELPPRPGTKNPFSLSRLSSRSVRHPPVDTSRGFQGSPMVSSPAPTGASPVSGPYDSNRLSVAGSGYAESSSYSSSWRDEKSPAGPGATGHLNPFADPGESSQPPPAYTPSNPQQQDLMTFNPEPPKGEVYQPPIDYTNQASSSTSYNPPSPRPLDRAGTFDSQTGQFRNLKAISEMTQDELRAKFGSVSGVSLLKEVDTVFVIDNSGSMAEYGFWSLIRVVLSYLAPIVATYDTNGYTAYALNTESDAEDDHMTGTAGGGWDNLRTADDIIRIFQEIEPSGTTPIDTVLERILDVYMERVRRRDLGPPKPLNVIVLTDGGSDDPDGVKETIINTCKELDQRRLPKTQLGIQFVQIGDYKFACNHIERYNRGNPQEIDRLKRNAARDIEDATRMLQSIDNLMGSQAADPSLKKMRDIVDTKSAQAILDAGGFDPVVLITVLCGALNKRFDKTVL